MKGSLEEIREIYAGMEGFVPYTAGEAYQNRIIQRMYQCAIRGLAKEEVNKPTQNIERPNLDGPKPKTYLIARDHDEKFTAEDYGSRWAIQEWAACNEPDREWNLRRAFTLTKQAVRTLAEIEPPQKNDNENTITIPVGEVNRDNRCGDFYNAVDELVSWFMGNTLESDVMFAQILRLYADRLEME